MLKIDILRKDLIEEELLMVAVMGAISRSSKSIDDLIEEFSEIEGNNLPKYKNFISKWIKQYKHFSMLDHAVIHLRLSGISQYLIKITETFNLVSDLFPLAITELSTRFVDFSKITADNFFIPEVIQKDTVLLSMYKNIINKQLNFYRSCLSKIKISFDANSKIPYDICRGILPTGTPSEYNLTLSFRSLGNLLIKLLYKKYNEPELSMSKELDNFIEELSNILFNEFSFIYDKNFYENKINMLYYQKSINGYTFESIKKYIQILINKAIKNFETDLSNIKIINCNISKGVSNKFFNFISKYKSKDYLLDIDFVSNIIEREERQGINYNIEACGVIDFGAYRDISRHRGLKFINDNNVTDFQSEPTLIHHPDLYKFISIIEINEFYKNLFIDILSLVEHLDGNSSNESYLICANILNYILPMAISKTVVIKGRLDQFIHLIQERTQKSGHANYKDFAQKLLNQLSYKDNDLFK